MFFLKFQTLTSYFQTQTVHLSLVVGSTHSLALYVILVHKVVGTTIRRTLVDTFHPHVFSHSGLQPPSKS